MYGLKQTVAPTAEPVTLQEVKRHLRIGEEISAHDAYLESLIVAARQEVESRTNRQLVTATWQLKLKEWPFDDGVLYLPKAPLQSVVITYLESSAGASTTWASSNYIVSTSKEPGEVTLAYQAMFPALYPVADAVTVTFVAGYGAAAAVPQRIKQLILLLVQKWFDSDSPKGIDGAIDSLVDGTRYGDSYVNYAGDND